MEDQGLVFLQIKVTPVLKAKVVERYQELRQKNISNYVRGLIEKDLATAEKEQPTPRVYVPEAVSGG